MQHTSNRIVESGLASELWAAIAAARNDRLANSDLPVDSSQREERRVLAQSVMTAHRQSIWLSPAWRNLEV